MLGLFSGISIISGTRCLFISIYISKFQLGEGNMLKHLYMNLYLYMNPSPKKGGKCVFFPYMILMNILVFVISIQILNKRKGKSHYYIKVYYDLFLIHNNFVFICLVIEIVFYLSLVIVTTVLSCSGGAKEHSKLKKHFLFFNFTHVNYIRW